MSRSCPSLETSAGPTGSPACRPCETVGTRFSHNAAEHVSAAAALMLAHLFHVWLEAAHGVEVGELLADAVAAAGNLAQPRQVAEQVSKTSSIAASATGCPFGHDAAGVGDLDLGAPLVQLAHDHGDALKHVYRLEPGNDAGMPYFSARKR